MSGYTRYVIPRVSATGCYPHLLAIPLGGDIPNPYDGDFNDLNGWVKENITKGFRYYWDRYPDKKTDVLEIHFEDSGEAMMFKLRWGGRRPTWSNSKLKCQNF